jgi:hypothetical protein
MHRHVVSALFVSSLLAPLAAEAQLPLMVPDWDNDRVMLFSGQDGSIIDLNWITDTAGPYAFSSPKEAAVVGNQIWVSDQIEDSVHRFDFNRNYLGTITNDASGNTLDNIRGFGYDGTNVYLTRFHGTSTLRGVVVINAATATATNFWAVGTNSLFDAEPFGPDDVLVANSTTDDIERRNKTTGALVNVFAANIEFCQPVATMPDGSIITASTIASAGIEGIYHFNPDGSLRRFIDTEPLKPIFGEQVPHGAWVLANGDYLITADGGVYTYNVANNAFTQVVGGVDGQFINPFVPEPSALGLIALAGVLALRRRT